MLARMSRGSGAVVNYRIEGSWRNAAMQFRSLDNLNGPVVFGGLVAQRSTPVFDAGGSSCFSVKGRRWSGLSVESNVCVCVTFFPFSMHKRRCRRKKIHWGYGRDVSFPGELSTRRGLGAVKKGFSPYNLCEDLPVLLRYPFALPRISPVKLPRRTRGVGGSLQVHLRFQLNTERHPTAANPAAATPARRCKMRDHAIEAYRCKVQRISRQHSNLPLETLRNP